MAALSGRIPAQSARDHDAVGLEVTRRAFLASALAALPAASATATSAAASASGLGGSQAGRQRLFS